MGEKRQIFFKEESQIIYVDASPSRRWNLILFPNPWVSAGFSDLLKNRLWKGVGAGVVVRELEW